MKRRTQVDAQPRSRELARAQAPGGSPAVPHPQNGRARVKRILLDKAVPLCYTTSIL